MAAVHFIDSGRTFQHTNFAVLRTLAAITEGNLLPSIAAARLQDIHAPAWMVAGLLSFDYASFVTEPAFGFTSHWFGNVAGVTFASAAAEESAGEA